VIALSVVTNEELENGRSQGKMFTEMGMAYHLSQAEEVWARLQA
jgi:hypothetical protein